MSTNVIMPQMGESIVEGTITKWLKKVGDPIQRDEPLFEISTDKVDSEIPSPATGVLTQIRHQEGETVQINTVVAVISEGGVTSRVTEPVMTPQPDARQPSSTPQDLEAAKEASEQTFRSSPLVRRIAKEESVDLSQIEGTGLGGRITKKDILSHLSQKPLPEDFSRRQGEDSSPPVGGSPRATSEHVEIVPMTAMRKSIAEHMVASRRISAHVTTVFEVDMTRIVQIKNQFSKEFLNREGIKLSYMPFFIKAIAHALKGFPSLNASIVEASIHYKKDINIGVAVALDWGLIVPVIKNADERSFLGIARDAVNLAKRARQKRLSPEDVQNGTFAITNAGVFGSLLGTPIINQPQVAILCIGAITKRPVVIQDAVAIRSMVFLTLTFDHRLIDGAVADQFMGALKSSLENWDEPLL
jgi:pyruvate dehydrogenase E2 component (dihydrolipoyllysine-residue acetyltransferase)